MSEFKWRDLVGDYIELRNAYDTVCGENRNLWEQIAQHTKTIADYEKRLQAEENAKVIIRGERDAALAEVKLYKNNQTAAEPEDTSESYKELRDDYDSLVDDYNDSQSYIMQMKSKLKVAEDTILDLRHTITEKDRKIFELKDELAALRRTMKTSEEIANDAVSEKDDLIRNREYEIDTLRGELDKLEDTLKSYESQEGERQKEIADYKATIKELEEENKYLKTQSAIYGDDDDLPWY